MKSRTFIQLTILTGSLFIAVSLHAGENYRQGRIAFGQRNYDKAMEHFQASARANPGNGNPVFYMGYIQENRDNQEAAINFYRRAVNLRMNNDLRSMAYWKIVLHYRYIEDWENLSIYTERFLQFENHADIRRLRDLANENRDPHIEQIRNLQTMAESARESQNFERAENAYKRILSLRGDYATVRWDLAMLLMQQRKYQQACPHFRELIELDPSVWEYHYRAGVCFYHTKQYEAAMDSFEKAKSFNTDPDDQFTFFLGLGEGLTEIERGNYSTAEGRLQEARSIRKTPALLGGLARTSWELQQNASLAIEVNMDHPDSLQAATVLLFHNIASESDYVVLMDHLEQLVENSERNLPFSISEALLLILVQRNYDRDFHSIVNVTEYIESDSIEYLKERSNQRTWRLSDQLIHPEDLQGNTTLATAFQYALENPEETIHLLAGNAYLETENYLSAYRSLSRAEPEPSTLYRLAIAAAHLGIHDEVYSLLTELIQHDYYRNQIRNEEVFHSLARQNRNLQALLGISTEDPAETEETPDSDTTISPNINPGETESENSEP